MAEDGFDTFVTVAAQGEGALAGGLKPVIAIGFAKAQDSQAAAVGLLGVFAGRQDTEDKGFCGRPDLRRPAPQALRGPLAGLAV